MNISWPRRLAGPVSMCFVLVAVRTALSADRPLVTFGAGFDVRQLAPRDVAVQLIPRDGRAVLRLETGHREKWPGITFKPAAGSWDLSDHEYLVVEVKNVGEAAVRVGLRADSPGNGGPRSSVQQIFEVNPGEERAVYLPLERKMPARLAGKLFGMRGYPGQLHPDRGVDPARIEQVLVFASQPGRDHVMEIGEPCVGGQYEGQRWFTDDLDQLFPMIDRFGQYMHRDWPGKTKAEADLARHRKAEAEDLARCPGPPGWNQYGGWEAGPQLPPTGRFRAEKHAGKWWLVDPSGRLFWSHGIDCVRPTTATTPITDRVFYFADLPGKDSPLSQFYGRDRWAPHGYYQDKGAFDTFNFTGANLYRKYGAGWREEFNTLCHRRLRSWGLNTIANWSDPEVSRLARTPYVVTASSGRRPIEGSSGYWGKFPDPFDPDFAATVRRNVSAQKEMGGSAWCVGVFVDNELAWGDEVSLAVAALASPARQPAKRRFLEELKGRYGTVQRLNAAWGTAHRSWDALRESTTPPHAERARADLASFYTRIAEEYFRVCRDAVKESLPQTLYLGCRFAWVNDRAVRAAAKYCDVIGFNKYAYSVADFRLPEGIDAPAIIGEFHFGALDRGMFHTGLRATKDQAERAAAYKRYVQGALKNPLLVGTHWFQFGDQATTGRGDGENYQIGFLDVCDTPYPETIQASREVGADLYRLRLAP